MEYRVHTAAIGMQRAIGFNKVEVSIGIADQLPGHPVVGDAATLCNRDIPAGSLETGLCAVRLRGFANEVACDFLHRIAGLESCRIQRDGAGQYQRAAAAKRNLATDRGNAADAQVGAVSHGAFARGGETFGNLRATIGNLESTNTQATQRIAAAQGQLLVFQTHGAGAVQTGCHFLVAGCQCV